MTTKTTQDPYGGGNAPRVEGSATSEAAAESIEPAKLTLRDTVHALLVRARKASHLALASGVMFETLGGLTDDEIERITGLKHQTASARRRELVLLGQVVDSGQTRETRSGRQATVWRAVAPGEQLTLGDGPSQVDVVRDKLRALLGKLDTLEQLDAVWKCAKAQADGKPESAAETSESAAETPEPTPSGVEQVRDALKTLRAHMLDYDDVPNARRSDYERHEQRTLEYEHVDHIIGMTTWAVK